MQFTAAEKLFMKKYCLLFFKPAHL